MKKFKRCVKLKVLPKILFVVSCFALVFAFAFSSHAYSYDPNTGNLNSDNLARPFYTDSTQNIGGVSCTFDDVGIATLNGTSTATGSLWLCQNVSITESGTYYFEIFNALNLGNSSFIRLDNNSSTAITLIRNTTTGVSVNLEIGTFSALLWVGSSGQVFNNLIIKPMLVKGSDKPSTFEPYGVEWYSSDNYNNYGVIRYNNGRASVENQFYYFDDKIIKYYTNNDVYVGQEILHQNSFTNFTINATNIIEPYYEQHSITSYYGKITLNILSSDFYANFIYPVSTVDGTIVIYYADGTKYIVESYTLNREFHIYDGSVINSEKYITDIYIDFHYDSLLSIDINTSANVVYYNNGYNDGYDKGYTNGNVEGQQVGRNNGYNEGYNVGYNDGINEDTNSNYKTLIWTIASTPWESFKHIWSFDILGLNIANIVIGFIMVLFLIYLIKKIWR